MDYPCGRFGDCSFGRFGFIVRTNRHTDTAKGFTPVTVVGITTKPANLTNGLTYFYFPFYVLYMFYVTNK